MNKVLIGLTFFLLNNFLFSQNTNDVLSINGKGISKNEFLQIYLKNNNSPKFDKQSIDEYLELYKKFKLKVTEAEALGYDTLPKLLNELSGYRKTLSNSYLIDKEENEKLVKEAYSRLKKEIKASHILIKLNPNASEEDTLEAFNKINDLRNKIIAGADFNSIAKQHSDDPSASYNNGDLGYFTAFQMVYPFEEAAFNTPLGEISKIVRTRFGYHILKITDQRDSRGIMKAAHIMISIKKDAPNEEVEIAKRKIEEIYQKLENGEAFDELAINYSDDPGSSDKGGKLPEFGSGSNTRMVTEFEDQAFKLEKNGDFSKPFRTDFGFHIVKRINHTSIGSFESMKKDLQNKVNKDERSKITQKSLVEKLKKEYNFSQVNKKSIKWFLKNLDSNYYLGKWNYSKLKSNEVIFSLENKNFTQKDFAEYLLKNYKNTPKTNNKTLINNKLNNWIHTEVINYEDSRLEKKYPEFKSLMQEYHDGVLLYEIMTDKVWNKAIKDTIGLNIFYNNNISKYQWKERIDATIYECLNKEIANKVLKMLKTNDTINSKHILAQINQKSELNLNVRMNKYEIDELPYLSNQKIKKGINSLIEYKGKIYVLKVDNIIPPCPKTLKEAKGLIISDYQNQLEKDWLEELQKKYSFVINEELIYHLDK
jgi:peptidyl-prolyl cis-trans isomerase SurA